MPFNILHGFYRALPSAIKLIHSPAKPRDLSYNHPHPAWPQHPSQVLPCPMKTRAPSQYPKRRLSVRSRKVSKPRDLCLELSDRYEIWQALRQQCCRCACQISKRYDNLKYQSRGFEILRDLTKRRLFIDIETGPRKHRWIPSCCYCYCSPVQLNYIP